MLIQGHLENKLSIVSSHLAVQIRTRVCIGR